MDDQKNLTTPAPRRVLLSTREAAACLGLAPATLERWRCERAGQGPPWLKFGGRVLYAPDDLTRYIEACTRHPEPGGRR